MGCADNPAYTHTNKSPSTHTQILVRTHDRAHKLAHTRMHLRIHAYVQDGDTALHYANRIRDVEKKTAVLAILAKHGLK